MFLDNMLFTVVLCMFIAIISLIYVIVKRVEFNPYWFNLLVVIKLISLPY